MRKDKLLGKGYDANVTLASDPTLTKELADIKATELCEVLNVSAVASQQTAEAPKDFEPASEMNGLWLKVALSDAAACQRCYRRTGDVGKLSEHAGLCARCAGVMTGKASA